MTADWRATLEQENAKLRALLVRAKCDVVPPHLREDIDKALAEPQVNPSETVAGWPCPHRVGLSFSDPADPTGLGAYAEYVRADVAVPLAEGEESREP